MEREQKQRETVKTHQIIEEKIMLIQRRTIDENENDMKFIEKRQAY